MILSKANTDLANEVRRYLQSQTASVSDGEGVAMVLLWSFLMDHARIQGIDVIELARHQMESFIKHVGADGMELVKEEPSRTH